MHAQYFALINLNWNIQIWRNQLPAEILYPYSQVSWSKNLIFWIVQRVCQQIPSAFWPYFMELQSLKTCVEGKKSYFTLSEILGQKNGVSASV